MFSFNALSVRLTHRRVFGLEQSPVSPPPIGVKLLEASVGNAPTWVEGGLDQHRDYWHSYSCGALSETAQTRRQVLETLVPRLAIGDRCTCHDRFLVGRGDLRTSKIHLGSGNILMEPNDQYLCIVPDQRQPTGQVFLPCEGDSMTAIVLSKALLPAQDTPIKDPSILGQISSTLGS